MMSKSGRGTGLITGALLGAVLILSMAAREAAAARYAVVTEPYKLTTMKTTTREYLDLNTNRPVPQTSYETSEQIFLPVGTILEGATFQLEAQSGLYDLWGPYVTVDPSKIYSPTIMLPINHAPNLESGTQGGGCSGGTCRTYSNSLGGRYQSDVGLGFRSSSSSQSRVSNDYRYTVHLLPDQDPNAPLQYALYEIN